MPGDAHLNISSPGWAKHAWSSVFAPWNAGAAVIAFAGRFDPRATLDALIEHEVTTFCAPPTVWRMLIQHDLRQWKVVLREVNAAGEPVNPEIIEQVRRAWGLTLRDSYGQTETTMMIGNSPGQTVVPGSMGRPLPGYRVALIDADGLESDSGEIAIPLRPRPVGLMRGYQNERGEARADRGRVLPHRRRRLARRRRPHRLHWPRRRRVQIERLPPEPVRTGKRADRTCGGRGSRGRAGAGSVAPHDSEGLCHACSRPCAPTARRPRRSSPTCASACRPTSGCGGSSSSSCRRPYRERSAGSNCGCAKARSPTAANGRKRSSGSRIFRG